MDGPDTYYKRGDWNADCDRCAGTFKASELRREWQGYMVCRTCWEPRPPSDSIRVRGNKPLRWTRPEPDDIYIVVGPADPDSIGRIPPIE